VQTYAFEAVKSASSKRQASSLGKRAIIRSSQSGVDRHAVKVLVESPLNCLSYYVENKSVL